MRILFVSILFVGVALLASGAQDQKKPEPLTEGEVVSLLQASVAPQRVEELARKRGLAFEVTPAVERDLRNAGATDALIEALRRVAPKPTAPASAPTSAVILIVQSTPGGAQVFVDDELIARASAEGRLKISTLSAGQHRLRLALEGYSDFEQTIDLASGSNTVMAALQTAHSAPPQPNPTVSRGSPKAYFGVMIQNLTPETAQTSKSPDTFGALVQQIDPQGPAAAAGLKPGDVVRSYNGKPLKTSDELVALVGAEEPGTEVGLEILRNGDAQNLVVKLAAPPPGFSHSVQITQGALRGLTLMDLTDFWRKALPLPPNTQGVVVNGIEPDTPAAQAGLVKGDVIKEVNRNKVSSLDDLQSLADKAQGSAVLLVNRQGKDLFIVLTVKP